jgi:hypothetical protein
MDYILKDELNYMMKYIIYIVKLEEKKMENNTCACARSLCQARAAGPALVRRTYVLCS